MRITSFKITRFQFARDRPIGDSQVESTEANIAALELFTDCGLSGLGFIHSVMTALPDEEDLEHVFMRDPFSSIEGERCDSLAHRLTRPRGGNNHNHPGLFDEAIQHAVWDLVAKFADAPLWRVLGGTRARLPAYASGLDFHLSDDEFVSLFETASSLGFKAFKIKVGHSDLGRDIHRLNLLRNCVGPEADIMIDANEAWSCKKALLSIETIQREGHRLYWVEDPVLRDDFDGLRMLRSSLRQTRVNSGEYLSLSGKRELLTKGCADILNVHGRITDGMQIGWLAAEYGIPISLGNTTLEMGINLGLALPETDWIEYSFLNYEHLVERSYRIEDGFIWGSDTSGHGLILSEEAREKWRRPVMTEANTSIECPKQVFLTA